MSFKKITGVSKKNNTQGRKKKARNKRKTKQKQTNEKT